MTSFQKAILVLFIMINGISLAQRSRSVPKKSNNYAQLSGPRVGLTLLTGEAAKIAKDDYDLEPLIAQFGWQFETKFFSIENGPTGVTEFVVLVGGFDQGLLIPSLTWLSGIRNINGNEIGFGPNISPTGAAVALAFGITKNYGQLNVPLNIAFVKSKGSVRISILAGFNSAIY